MKPRPCPKLPASVKFFRFSFIAWLAWCTSAIAVLEPAHWQFRQELRVQQNGVQRVAVPVETLDRLQPDYRDLRVVSATGAEVPFALLTPWTETIRWEPAIRFRSSLADVATVITVECGRRARWESLELITTAPAFLKSARIEVSVDGTRWTELAAQLPFFRQNGAEQTRFSIGGQEASAIRVTLADDRQAPIAITGARLLPLAEQDITREPVSVRLTRTDNFADESLLTLELPAANLDLDSIELEVTDAFFTRPVEALTRQMVKGEVRLDAVAQGTVFRMNTGDQPSANTKLLIRRPIAGRELVIRVENGDSPPLSVTAVHATRRVVHVVFHAAQAGVFTLWSGNPDAAAPRYDVSALTKALGQVPAATVAAGPLSPHHGYSRPDPLASIDAAGRELDRTGWKRGWQVICAEPGIQLLDLNLDVLAHSGAELEDVRLVRHGRQIPYLVERPGTDAVVTAQVVADPDAQRRTISRWKLELPFEGPPVTRVLLETDTPLFDRLISVYERRPISNGGSYLFSLGSAHWRRVPGSAARPASVSISRPLTRTLYIETDNGENPPIQLTTAKLTYPVTRLLFRVPEPGSIELLAGNSQAIPPKYDLALAAPLLMTAAKHNATLVEVQVESAQPPEAPKKIPAAAFWGALGAAVLVLLVVVAKLLPKPEQK
jgi:hypothetical protein